MYFNNRLLSRSHKFYIISLVTILLIILAYLFIKIEILSPSYIVIGLTTLLILIPIIIFKPAMGILVLICFDLGANLLIRRGSDFGYLVPLGVGNAALIGLLFLIVVTKGFTFKPFVRIKTPIDKYVLALMALAILYGAIGFLRSNDLGLILGDFYIFFLVIGMTFFVTTNLFINQKTLREFVWGLLIIIFLFSIFLLILCVTESIKIFPGGELGRNEFFRLPRAKDFPSFYLVFFLCLWIHEKRRIPRVILGVTSLMLIIFLSINLQRTAWVAFAGTVIFIFLMVSPKLKVLLIKNIMLIVLFMSLIVFGIIFRSTPENLNRIVTRFTSLNQASEARTFQMRMAQNKGLIMDIRQNPFGYGLGSVFKAEEYKSGLETHGLHNVPLRISAQIGIIGGIFYYVMIIIVFKEGIKLYRVLRDNFLKSITLGSLAILFNALIMGLGSTATFSTFYLSISMAFIFIIRYYQKFKYGRTETLVKMKM